MQARIMRSIIVAVGRAALLGLLLIAAPLSGAAAPDRPTPSVGPASPAGKAVPDASGVAQDAGSPLDQARLHPALRRMLAASCPAAGPDCQDDRYIPIIVEWKRGPGIEVQTAAGATRLERRQQVVANLRSDAQRSSAALVAALDEAAAADRARNVRPFWASPIIALEAKPDLIGDLSGRADVVQIRPDEPIYLDHAPLQTVSSPGSTGTLPWNLRMLDVGLANEALGLDGTGVVVANMDTGVDWRHPALMRQYRGYRDRDLAVHYGNWHVSTGEPYLYPGDGEGHGTHTMGTIVGDDGAGNRLGVAPGARWIAVKIFDNSGVAYESWIHDGFQWILAPEGDPALAPDIVSNSWGSIISSDDRFRPDLAALRAGGILPVFAAGNYGPEGGTVISPGSLPEALAVGAVDEDMVPATFSGRGPSPWGEIKPEVTAPGVNILSSFPGGGLALGTGTSMATPHVAGLAALLLQANPNLTPDQLEYLLESTARPLGSVVPNNTTGWGLVNAYAAALRVTASGEIVGRVVRTDGGGLAQAEVTAASHDGIQVVTVGGNAEGRFSIALRPGLYDVTGRAFGFDPNTQPGIEVRAGTQTSVTLSLTAQPAGSIFGRITDLQTGAPLSAAIAVAGTPVVVQSDSNTGLYSMALPAGHYTASVTAVAHRVGHLDVPVVAGLGREADVALPQAPRVLLVDSGRWYYDSQIQYFEEALASEDYPFTLWPIRDPFAMYGPSGDRPTAEDLAPYDAVIWSAPLDSPGLIDADSALTEYLLQGGRLLVSGQDVAYWDGGGSLVNYPAQYFTQYLGLWFKGEGNSGGLTGVAGTPLAGVSVALNTPDSARQQLTPDDATVNNPLLAQPALLWPTGAIGGAVAGACRPWRDAWLGFGLEGAGPGDTRAEILGRLLEWFASPPDSYGLVSTMESHAPGSVDGSPLIGAPGTAVSQTIRLDNIGIHEDAVDILVRGGPWPIDIALPDGHHASTDTQITIEGCGNARLVVTVDVPPDQPRGASAAYTLSFISRGDPAFTVSNTLKVKTPAPILFVDDERWYDHHDAYTSTLDALELSYDLFSTQGGDATPNADTLRHYPMVVWATGYDWYSPITKSDEGNLSGFLDGGGRLLLSSQDALDVRGLDEFVHERLGVADTSLSVTGTEVIALPGSPLGADLGPWGLTFPFRDWSDALTPAPEAEGTLQNERLFTVGVVRPAANWRTAFFSFPLETLAGAAREALFGRTLVWLSPLGESRLEAPPVAAEGSRIPITLTLGLAAGSPRTGLGAAISLPPDAGLAPGSLRGPWQYDAVERTLVWKGDLSPEEAITLGADLDLTTEIPDGSALPLRAHLFAGDGITVTADAPVRVDAPWLELREQADPAQPGLHGTVEYTFAITNAGVAAAAASFTDTWPAGLEPVPGTAWTSTGTAAIGPQVMTWSGAVAPGSTATFGCRARVTSPRAGVRLIDRAALADQLGRRVVSWAVISIPAHSYLPLVSKQAP
jgi:uncharacterized repeat protein (TIGR01451 family)